MKWIKNNYDRFLLLIASLVLLISSGMLFLNASGYLQEFDLQQAVDTTEIVKPDFAALEAASARLEQPEVWNRRPIEEASLLVSRPLLLFQERLIDPRQPESPKIHPPVENQWFIDFNLPIEEKDVLEQDADDDGFENLLEYTYKTDPTNAEEHPPYPIKLVLASIIPNPELLRYSSRPSDGFFAIDRPRTGEPTQFLQMDDIIPGTPWKLVEHEEKEVQRENLPDVDVSELIVEDTETGEREILVHGETTDVGDITGRFLYLWKGEQEILKKVDENFTLSPEEDVEYKVIDIEEDGAVIERLTDNEQFNIKKS